MKHAKYRLFARIATLVLFGLAFGACLLAQTGTGSLHGLVTDPSGAVVPGASVQATGPGGNVQTAASGADGMYDVKNLAPGKYTIAVAASGFAQYLKDSVDVAAGQTLALNISLSVAAQTEQVTVSGEVQSLDTTPSNNAGAVALSQKELDALPDDPDELQADLEALAGPASGPNGGQMYIDGFTAGQLPPKSSIREIRINTNPFSAEYDMPGFGRIEILTKPGGNAWHGSGSVNRNQQAFNTRNPFAPSGGNFQSTQYNGNVGGGVGKKISLFFNADYRKIDNSSVINAVILDPAFNPTSYQALDPLPQERLNIGPRFDLQVSKNNTLSVRYQYLRNTTTNNGVGNFTLPVQGSNALQEEHQVQVTDSQYFGSRVVYETRFQYLHQVNNSLAANPIPSVTVPGAFTGGGSGDSTDTQNRYELQSYTSVAFVKHFLKFGARIREATDSNNSITAFFGAFQFSSLSAYQNMVKGLSNGLTMAGVIAQNGCNTGVPTVSNGACGPIQYSITAGNPHESVSVIDAGPFIQDDWKLRPNITLSYGMRFETQNHISDHMDWAPRVALAWGLGGSKTAPKYIVRAGWGMFYSRFAQANILQALRQNGITEQQYLVSNPNFYCGPLTALGTALASQCPAPGSLSSIATSTVPTIYQIAPVFHAPYQMQTSVSVERQLTRAVQVSLTYLNSRGFNQLLQENINSPVLPGTQIPTAVANGGVYPNGITENIYQYASAGRFRQNQVIVNTTIRGRKLTFNAFYSLNYADSTPNGFVSNPYDIFQDYGRAGNFFGIQHRAFFLGNIALPYGMSLSPSVMINSGAPYSVTIGKDLLGTGQFNQRPGFISSTVCPTTVIAGSVYCTSVGTFDSVPTAGEAILPVNSLTGPNQFTVNMRLAKTFTFGGHHNEPAQGPGGGFGGPGGFGPPGGGPPPGGGGPPPGGGGPGGGFGGGGFGGGGGGAVAGRFSFTASVNARNLFNTVNLSAPVGNLTSPLFGESESLAGGGPGGTSVANRQIYLQGTFNF